MTCPQAMTPLPKGLPKSLCTALSSLSKAFSFGRPPKAEKIWHIDRDEKNQKYLV